METNVEPNSAQAAVANYRGHREERQLAAWRAFGTIGYDGYLAHVLATEARTAAKREIR